MCFITPIWTSEKPMKLLERLFIRNEYFSAKLDEHITNVMTSITFEKNHVLKWEKTCLNILILQHILANKS